ncbi:hypothetical protein C8A01DRAFT_48140 [Parachaetomium inaequale]|uniref:Cyclin N-terminal domain-containing protein n=1 Tax=Parachaetomium inaequale TaxID=2588326 RepID=A0AAN6PCQ1_9PEZI|nr:hypothetical protein C8A01DRAFT_48140 [Parachaetomium inaequale]
MDYSFPMLSPAELNAAALDKFVRQVVDEDMISHLAQAASDVIQCDSDMMPPPAPASRPRQQPSARAIKSSDTALPTVEEFITQLVKSSNVQVGTLMSTLVYLRRLKSRLQPMAKGLRCTTHRILLAALILTAKYLNDSSPKNKHWASYSVVDAYPYNFGFSRTEVNLMEKQLLFLLDWDLRITQEDLYTEFEGFLAPLRDEIEERYVRRMQRKLEQEARERQLLEERAARQRERDEEASMWRVLAQQQLPQSQEPTTAYATPPYSRETSRSREQSYSPSHSRGSSRDVSPPGLLYSSGSSYADSTSSRATTPLSEHEMEEGMDDDDEADITTVGHHQPYIYDGAECDVYDSPMQVEGVYDRPSVPEKDAIYLRKQPAKQMLLPYEISAEDLRSLEESAAAAAAAGAAGRNVGGLLSSGKRVRGVFGRVFGTAR